MFCSNAASTGSIPVLKCRGTHYEVGFQIGQAFKSMIRDLLETWTYFNNTLLKIGSTQEGKSLIDSSLQLCKIKYPGYIDEIKGMADGVGIDFEKLFILNIDSILCTLDKKNDNEDIGGTGCTTIICNKDEIILGHTEDALAEIKNHVYIVSAEIQSDEDEHNNERVILEKFTTLCYAGTLMGYTMGYNSHGMVYSVNTIFPIVYTAGTPRAFIARSLLGASDLPSLLNVLKDKGNGTADGFSLNVCFYPKKCADNRNNTDEGHNNNSKTILYNIEVASPRNDDDANDKESVVDVHEIRPGTSFTHCNRYARIKATEHNPTALMYSDRRSSVLCKHYKEPTCEDNVREILSDQTDYDYPIFNNGKDNGEEYKMSFIRTVAIGIFNITHRTWSVYTESPKVAEPVQKFAIE